MGRLAVDVAGEMDPTVAVTKTSALRGGWAGKTRSAGRVCLSRQKESGMPSSRWFQRGQSPLCGVWGAPESLAAWPFASRPSRSS